MQILNTKFDPFTTIRPPFYVILRADFEKHTPEVDLYEKRKVRFFDTSVHIFKERFPRNGCIKPNNDWAKINFQMLFQDYLILILDL